MSITRKLPTILRKIMMYRTLLRENYLVMLMTMKLLMRKVSLMRILVDLLLKLALFLQEVRIRHSLDDLRPQHYCHYWWYTHFQLRSLVMLCWHLLLVKNLTVVKALLVRLEYYYPHFGWKVCLVLQFRNWSFDHGLHREAEYHLSFEDSSLDLRSYH